MASDELKAELSAYETGMRALLARISAAGVPVDFRREIVPAGSRVLDKGQVANSFVLLEDGRLFATVEESTRVATFLPGAVVGEIGFVTASVRTASVVAETQCLLRRVTRADLDRLREHDPALALELTGILGCLMAQRLARTTALLHAVSQ